MKLLVFVSFFSVKTNKGFQVFINNVIIDEFRYVVLKFQINTYSIKKE